MCVCMVKNGGARGVRNHNQGVDLKGVCHTAEGVSNNVRWKLKAVYSFSSRVIVRPKRIF